MRGGVIIFQKTLRAFIKQKRLRGTVAFLNFIKKQAGMKEFYNFCNKNNHRLPEQLLDKALFHGSPQKQTVLVPRASIGRDSVAEQEAFVYATDDPNYAIFLAVLNLRKFGGASVYASPTNTQLSVSLGFVNSASKLKNGYVHVVPSKFFKKTANREYQATKAISVLFTISVTPQDLTVPIYIKTKP